MFRGVFVLLALLVVVAAVGFVVWSAREALTAGRRRLAGAAHAKALATARWVPAHDEIDGRTRILLQRAATSRDGSRDVLEQRVFRDFPADDELWQARFTEAMSEARFRCEVLNSEDQV
jgi:hypothetical protein